MLSLIVCGGRNYNDRARVFEVLDGILRTYKHVSIIHGAARGAARGADSLSERWARWRNASHGVTFEAFPARDFSWPTKRNEHMLNVLLLREEPGHKIGVVAFPGGTGTAHMRRIAEEAGVKVLIVDP